VNIVDLIKYLQNLVKNSKFKVVVEGKPKKVGKAEKIQKTNILTRQFSQFNEELKVYIRNREEEVDIGEAVFRCY